MQKSEKRGCTTSFFYGKIAVSNGDKEMKIDTSKPRTDAYIGTFDFQVFPDYLYHHLRA